MGFQLRRVEISFDPTLADELDLEIEKEETPVESYEGRNWVYSYELNGYKYTRRIPPLNFSGDAFHFYSVTGSFLLGPRQLLKEVYFEPLFLYIENNVRKSTTALFVGSTTTGATKILQADKYGIPIYSESEMYEALLQRDLDRRIHRQSAYSSSVRLSVERSVLAKTALSPQKMVSNYIFPVLLKHGRLQQHT
jgi:type III secretion system FlhB-like substrate exporter